MWRNLFLTLILFSSIAWGQTPEKKEPFLFFEFEKIGNKILREKLQSFCGEINKRGWVGLIIIEGSAMKIRQRIDQIQKNYPSPGTCHETRVKFLDRINQDQSKTELWIVPPGEKLPFPTN